MPQRHYTVTEVADILRVTPYHARSLCKAGKIPGAMKPAGTWLIDRTTFDAWLEAQAAGGAA